MDIEKKEYHFYDMPFPEVDPLKLEVLQNGKPVKLMTYRYPAE